MPRAVVVVVVVVVVMVVVEKVKVMLVVYCIHTNEDLDQHIIQVDARPLQQSRKPLGDVNRHKPFCDGQPVVQHGAVFHVEAAEHCANLHDFRLRRVCDGPHLAKKQRTMPHDSSSVLLQCLQEGSTNDADILGGGERLDG